MALDLKKNKDSIVSAWKDVSNPDSSNTWAIFGYEGQTGVLKVVEIGDGEFDEMVDSLNSGKIQYAYCRVTDPNTNLAKFVLVNWQGDGAPDTLKGRCAGHVRDIGALLRGAHVTINARDEEDLDTDDVLKQVAKSSGSNYSVHKEKPRKVEEPTAPIGSVYQKVRPQAEININKRDQFWEKTQNEETERKNVDVADKKKALQKLDQERRQREETEAKEREKRINEHSKQVEQQRASEKQAAVGSKQADKFSHDSRDDDDNERRNRSESLRKQRAAEAASLVQQRENNPREMFKQRERAASQDESQPPPTAPKKAIRQFPPAAQQAPEPEPRQPSPPPARRQPSPPPAREPSPPPREPSPPPREASPPPQLPPSRELPPEPQSEPSVMSQGLPRRQDSDEEEADDQDWETPDNYEPPSVDPYQEAADEGAGDAAGGPQARALYDYQACEYCYM